MSVKITGLDDVTKMLDNLVADITTGLVDLGNEIVKMAKEMCDDPNCERIIIKKLEFDNSTNEFHLQLDFKDKEAIDCMINAITTKLSSMNTAVKSIFEAQIKELQKQKANFKENGN